MIGIVLSEKKIKDREDDYYSFYCKLAKENHVDVCFYSIQKIDMKKLTVDGYVYDHKKDLIREEVVSIPHINLYKCNSSIFNKRQREKIETLQKEKNRTFFNACSIKERDKYDDHMYLKQFPSIRKHLLKTRPLSYKTLSRLLREYGFVFIKRRRSKKGNNIYTLERKEKNIIIKFYNKQAVQLLEIPKSELEKFCNRTFPKPEKFYVQQGVDLKRVTNKKFDVRVSPQKYPGDFWKVTGAIGRLGKENWDVTNLDQGGITINSLKKIISKRTKKELYRLSKDIAEKLADKSSNFIEFGLDFAIDEQENIWFLEANFQPYRKNIWVYRNKIPFRYVCSIYKNNTALRY
ncbi:hypothetical protein J2S74_002738 [Evansella vedderi]|uniref:YheC/YheD family protein n=1 Tax=Evansella vedderi TaxID=38282 RepID=A0ABT9ZX89_9BACI|nr:YheC/YheD family protein [Evansella vedderi]MDQ0255356.1 hypothetical protein [Evansella vedderi]